MGFKLFFEYLAVLKNFGQKIQLFLVRVREETVLPWEVDFGDRKMR